MIDFASSIIALIVKAAAATISLASTASTRIASTIRTSCREQGTFSTVAQGVTIAAVATIGMISLVEWSPIIPGMIDELMLQIGATIPGAMATIATFASIPVLGATFDDRDRDKETLRREEIKNHEDNIYHLEKMNTRWSKSRANWHRKELAKIVGKATVAILIAASLLSSYDVAVASTFFLMVPAGTMRKIKRWTKWIVRRTRYELRIIATRLRNAQPIWAMRRLFKAHMIMYTSPASSARIIRIVKEESRFGLIAYYVLRPFFPMGLTAFAIRTCKATFKAISIATYIVPMIIWEDVVAPIARWILDWFIIFPCYCASTVYAYMEWKINVWREKREAAKVAIIVLVAASLYAVTDSTMTLASFPLLTAYMGRAPKGKEMGIASKAEKALQNSQWWKRNARDWCAQVSSRELMGNVSGARYAKGRRTRAERNSESWRLEAQRLLSSVRNVSLFVAVAVATSMMLSIEAALMATFIPATTIQVSKAAFIKWIKERFPRTRDPYYYVHALVNGHLPLVLSGADVKGRAAKYNGYYDNVRRRVKEFASSIFDVDDKLIQTETASGALRLCRVWTVPCQSSYDEARAHVDEIGGTITYVAPIEFVIVEDDKVLDARQIAIVENPDDPTFPDWLNDHELGEVNDDDHEGDLQGDVSPIATILDELHPTS